MLSFAGVRAADPVSSELPYDAPTGSSPGVEFDSQEYKQAIQITGIDMRRQLDHCRDAIQHVRERRSDLLSGGSREERKFIEAQRVHDGRTLIRVAAQDMREDAIRSFSELTRLHGDYIDDDSSGELQRARSKVDLILGDKELTIDQSGAGIKQAVRLLSAAQKRIIAEATYGQLLGVTLRDLTNPNPYVGSEAAATRLTTCFDALGMPEKTTPIPGDVWGQDFMKQYMAAALMPEVMARDSYGATPELPPGR